MHDNYDFTGKRIKMPTPPSKFRKQRCFVPYCRSGYKNQKVKATLFNVPSQLSARCIWQQHIPSTDRQLHTSDVVCERHFAEEFLTRYREIQNIKYYHKRPKLKPGAVPTIFPDSLGNYIDTSKAITEKQDPLQIKHEFETVICDETNNFSSTLELEETVINYGGFHNNIIENTDERDKIGLMQVKIEESYETLLDIADCSKSVESNEILLDKSDTRKILQDQSDCKDIFATITKENLELFNWGFHCTNDEYGRYVILSQLKLSEAGPYAYKSMVIKEDLSCTLYYLNHEFETLNISSLEDVQTQLRNMENQNICKAGPKTSSYKPESYTSWAAFEDTSVNCWRHTNCSTISGKQLRCQNCTNLFRNFRRQQLQKQPKRTYVRKPLCSAIPNSYMNGVTLKQFNSYMQEVTVKEYKLRKRLQRAAIKISTLKGQINLLKSAKRR